MLRRLCLLLLMACLALPAMAAPLHCAPAPTIAAAAHHGHHSEKAPVQAPQHDCIGCIAPFASSSAPDRTDLPPVSREKPHDDLRLAGPVHDPDTPPPRA